MVITRTIRLQTNPLEAESHVYLVNITQEAQDLVAGTDIRNGTVLPCSYPVQQRPLPLLNMSPAYSLISRICGRGIYHGILYMSMNFSGVKITGIPISALHCWDLPW